MARAGQPLRLGRGAGNAVNVANHAAVPAVPRGPGCEQSHGGAAEGLEMRRSSGTWRVKPCSRPHAGARRRLAGGGTVRMDRCAFLRRTKRLASHAEASLHQEGTSRKHCVEAVKSFSIPFPVELRISNSHGGPLSDFSRSQWSDLPDLHSAA